MATLLRINALVSLAWAGVLFVTPAEFAAGPLARTLAQLLAAHYATLAGLCIWAARAPANHIAIVVAAIATSAARIVIDLVGLLGDLPPEPAVYFVVDLLVAVALLVGLLEALPRLRARRHASAPKDEA